MMCNFVVSNRTVLFKSVKKVNSTLEVQQLDDESISRLTKNESVTILIIKFLSFCKAKPPNIFMFQFLRCEDSKLNILGFWTVGRTKQDI